MKQNSNKKTIENSCNPPLTLHSHKIKRRKEKEIAYWYRRNIFKISLTQGKSELIQTSKLQFSAKTVLALKLLNIFRR